MQTVQKRGASVIAARKLSSAMSAAKAICDHMHDWFFGTKPVNVLSCIVLYTMVGVLQFVSIGRVGFNGCDIWSVQCTRRSHLLLSR